MEAMANIEEWTKVVRSAFGVADIVGDEAAWEYAATIVVPEGDNPSPWDHLEEKRAQAMAVFGILIRRGADGELDRLITGLGLPQPVIRSVSDELFEGRAKGHWNEIDRGVHLRALAKLVEAVLGVVVCYVQGNPSAPTDNRREAVGPAPS